MDVHKRLYLSITHHRITCIRFYSLEVRGCLVSSCGGCGNSHGQTRQSVQLWHDLIQMSAVEETKEIFVSGVKLEKVGCGNLFPICLKLLVVEEGQEH